MKGNALYIKIGLKDLYMDKFKIRNKSNNYYQISKSSKIFSKINKNTYLKNLNYDDDKHKELIQSYLYSDILSLDITDYYFILFLQFYYFKEYGYIDIDFTKNIKYIVNINEKN